MRVEPATEFAAVVREDGADRDAERLVEREHAIVEEIARRHRHLRGIDLGEGQGAEDVDDDLDVDLPDAPERAREDGVLIQRLTGLRRLDMATVELDAMAFEQAQLFFRVQASRA